MEAYGEIIRTEYYENNLRVKVEDCNIVMSFDGYYSSNHKYFFTRTYFLPVSNLTVKDGFLTLKDKGKKKIIIVKYEDGDRDNFTAERFDEFEIDINGETDLDNRLINAIGHLATFCQEAF